MKSLIALFLCSALGIGAAFAQMRGADAYRAQVPVADQSPGQRALGVQNALRQVIATVSGEDAVAGAEAIVNQAAQLVQQVSYQNDPENGLMLTAGFDGAALERRLRAAHLPVWGVVAGDPATVRVTIEHLDSAHAYLTALDALKKAAGVQRVSAQSAQGQRAEFEVIASGGADQVSRALRGSAVLRQQGYGDVLVFEYQETSAP